MAREGIPDVRNSIRELEAEWDRKWMDTLKDTPLASFLNEDPVSLGALIRTCLKVVAEYYDSFCLEGRWFPLANGPAVI